jgi:hypothetical protein
MCEFSSVSTYAPINAKQKFRRSQMRGMGNVRHADSVIGTFIVREAIIYWRLITAHAD